MEEANELLERVSGKREGELPLFTSCCPGWINYLELNRPDLLPHLSTTKSPQQMHGTLSRSGPIAKKIAAEGGEEPFVVSIMPCTAKKDEAVRPGNRGDIDAVLTTRELAKMIRHRNIPFASLSNDGQYDSPMGESSGAGAIFGASGGVLEAALRTAADALGLVDAPIEYEGVRGVERGIKVATIEGLGSVAAVSSIGSAIDLLSNDDWKKKFLMIEVMTCPGGCLGGGGEPKSDDKDILAKRMKGIYDIDLASSIRKSHENKEVQQLYKDVLSCPLSETCERLLHTAYAPRGSARDKLSRFLGAVDARDEQGASYLCASNVIWNTNVNEFGAACGKESIECLIKEKLPKVKKSCGEEIPRHRFLSPTSGTDRAQIAASITLKSSWMIAG